MNKKDLSVDDIYEVKIYETINDICFVLSTTNKHRENQWNRSVPVILTPKQAFFILIFTHVLKRVVFTPRCH